MTLDFELDLETVKVNQHAKMLNTLVKDHFVRK